MKRQDYEKEERQGRALGSCSLRGEQLRLADRIEIAMKLRSFALDVFRVTKRRLNMLRGSAPSPEKAKAREAFAMARFRALETLGAARVMYAIMHPKKAPRMARPGDFLPWLDMTRMRLQSVRFIRRLGPFGMYFEVEERPGRLRVCSEYELLAVWPEWSPL